MSMHPEEEIGQLAATGLQSEEAQDPVHFPIMRSHWVAAREGEGRGPPVG